MTSPPETRYARNGPVHRAYQVLGSGPPVLLVVNSGPKLARGLPGSHPSRQAGDDAFRRWYAQIQRMSPIRLDSRGEHQLKAYPVPGRSSQSPASASPLDGRQPAGSCPQAVTTIGAGGDRAPGASPTWTALDEIAALQQVQGAPAGRHRQPVGSQPIGDHGGDRDAGLDADADQEAGQTGLEGPDAARGAGRRRDRRGGQVGRTDPRPSAVTATNGREPLAGPPAGRTGPTGRSAWDSAAAIPSVPASGRGRRPPRARRSRPAARRQRRWPAPPARPCRSAGRPRPPPAA